MAGSSGDEPRLQQQHALRSPGLAHWLPAETVAEREQTAAVQRTAVGQGGWLEATGARFKERWDSVWAERWQTRASASAQPRDAPPPDPWHGWVLRSATEAREWVQAKDTVPMLGDCKHVWYSHGRPVVARRLIMIGARCDLPERGIRR
jgi:hypothetical protein